MSRTSGVVLLIALLAACAGPAVAPSAGTPSAVASSATATPGSSLPPGATAMRDGTMHPGVTYATTKFAVPFTVTVPADSPDRFWLSTSTSLARTLTIGHSESEGAGISFYLPTGGFNTNGTATAAPADFVAWLIHDPQLKASKPLAVTVGGRPATQLDVQAILSKIPAIPGLCPLREACVLVASTAPDAPLRPLLIYAGAAQRVIVVAAAQGQLLIEIDPEVEVRAPAERLLASLKFLG